MELKKPLVLIGLMGAGKTTMGRALALMLGIEFVDTDRVIEEQAGISIPEIFERDGEDFFRKVESRTIIDILSNTPPIILATGGGAFMYGETRDAIKQFAISIWLNAKLDTLVERVEHSNNRPLLQNIDKREKLKKLMDERYPVYAAADIVVDTDSNSRTIITNKIMEELEKWKS
jgi:shikimate kinase